MQLSSTHKFHFQLMPKLVSKLLRFFLETCCSHLQGATVLRCKLLAVNKISFFVVMIAKLTCGVPWGTVHTCFVY
jgi:hypothetical protein